jgi:hypothetical protein
MGFATNHNTGTAHGHVLLSTADRRLIRARRGRSSRMGARPMRKDWHPEAGFSYQSDRRTHRRHAMESRRG